MKLQRLVILATLGLISTIIFSPGIVNAIHCTNSMCECTEVDDDDEECVGTGYYCYCIDDELWGKDIECSGPYLPGYGCLPCEEYEDDDDDERFYGDCNSQDGWHWAGPPYECTNGSQMCTCQTEIYKDYYCLTGSCLIQTPPDTRIIYFDCHTPTTTTSTTTSTTSSSTTTSTTSSSTTTSTTSSSTTTLTTETSTSSTTTSTLITCSMRDENCALTTESDFLDCCVGLNCLPATAWNSDDGVCCHPRECILDGNCIEEGYRRDDEQVCQDGEWIWANCSTRDENCALTTESDLPDCCAGLNCQFTDTEGSDDGVCCHLKECTLEGNCVEEGHQIEDELICLNGLWVSINCSTRDENCALTTESDLPDCCVGLNCLPVTAWNPNDGVCCNPRECILEGNCIGEGYLRDDGRICQNGEWVSENETTTSTTSATTITETTFDEIIWDKEEHKNVSISYNRACVNEPVKIKALDEKGNPLKNAVFSIKFGGSFSGYGVVNDAGEFSFTPGEAGEYNIKVMKGEYFEAWNITTEVCEEEKIQIQDNVSLTISLSAKKEVTAGDEFNATVEIHAKDDIDGINAWIYLSEGFSVEYPSIRDETQIRKGENKSITWHITTTDFIKSGNYSLKVSVSPLTADEGNISNSTTIKVHEQRKDLVRIIQENTYGFTENVYEVTSKPTAWTILLLLLVLFCIYYMGSRRYYMRGYEIKRKIKKEEDGEPDTPRSQE